MTVETPVMLTLQDTTDGSGPPKTGSDWSGLLMTRTGFTFYVRSATPEDEEALAEFFSGITPEDLRFRFLTSLREVDHDRLELMTHVDHRRTEDFLAFELDGGPIIATAMLAADPAMEKAEVAISVRPDYKKRGIGWTLLRHVSRFAKGQGIRTLQSIESQDNHIVIELEREMGFTAKAFPGDPTLVLLEAELGAGADDAG